MRPSTALAVTLAVLLVASAVGAATAQPSAATAEGSFVTTGDDESLAVTGDDSPATTMGSVDPTAALGAPLEPAEPAQVIRIQVGEDGEVVWTVESRYRLGEGDHEAFEAYAESVTAGERDVGYDRETFERFAAIAAETTDREVEITDAGWDEPWIETDETGEETVDVGVVAYSATWTEFAVADGDRIEFGDALRTDDGTWLPSLRADQRLVIERPSAEYTFDRTPRGLQNGALVWDGPYEFAPEEIDVSFEYTGGDDGNGATDDGDGGEPGEGVLGSLLSPYAVGLGLVILAALGAGSYYVTARRPPAESTVATANEDGEPTAAEPAPEPDAIDPELLSDEERVLRLLRDRGGRMKQGRIVEETGWSNAKVSQLLSKMDENDEIEKLRIGRENLITLPEVDPTEVE